MRTWEEPNESNGLYETPICPICGEEAKDFFVNEKIGIVGCDRCTRKVDAWCGED